MDFKRTRTILSKNSFGKTRPPRLPAQPRQRPPPTLIPSSFANSFSKSKSKPPAVRPPRSSSAASIPLNPHSAETTRATARCPAGFPASSSGGNSHGKSSRNRTSSRLRRTASAALAQRRRAIFPTSPRPAAANNSVTEPNWFSKSAAVFGPTPGTPGMLSTLSPIKLNQSTICAGSTPVLARTCSFGPNRFAFVGRIQQPDPRRHQLHKILVGTGNDHRHARVRRAPRQAGDVIIRLHAVAAKRRHSRRLQITHRSRPVAASNRPAFSGRCALYSGNAAMRSALKPPSHTTTECVGSMAARIFASILTKP